MENFIKTTLRLWRWTVDLCVPPTCVVCGKLETWLCDTCVEKLPLFTGSVCAKCGRPEENVICAYCQDTPLSVSSIRSAYVFQDEIRDAIHAIKYRGAHSLIPLLAEQMAKAWRHYDMQSDLLIPVPLHPKRELQRGYNQSVWLAQGLGRAINVAVALNTLQRVRNTASQTKLNRVQRRKNVEAAFACKEGTDFSGKCVTLVDDVATTGATLEACAKVLLAHHASVVNAFTLARTS